MMTGALPPLPVARYDPSDASPCAALRCTSPCCDAHEVPLTNADAARIERGTGLERQRFSEHARGYLLLRGAGTDDEGCVFMAPKADARTPRPCTIHPHRPTACRTYPFILDFADAEPIIRREATICPIPEAFNEPPGVRQRLVTLWQDLQNERQGRLDQEAST